MKPSTVLATLLPTLALANPVKTAVDQQPALLVTPALVHPIISDPIVISPLPGNLERSDDLPDELDLLNDLITCLRNHKDFQPDFTQAKDGVFSISNVEPTCCQKGKELYSLLPSDECGKASFDEPCKGAIFTGINQDYMEILRQLFAEIAEGDVDKEK